MHTIHESEKNRNKLWATVNNILQKKRLCHLCQIQQIYPLFAFSTFFVATIEKIRLKFCTDNRKPEFIPPPEIKMSFDTF